MSPSIKATGNRFHVVNPNNPDQRDDLEGMAHVFGTLSTLLSVLGYPVFEPLAGGRTTQTLFCHGQDANATGALVEDGFVVRQGSVARAEIADASKEKLGPIRRELLDSGILVEEEGRLRFTKDHLCSSPTAAAALVLGYGVAGPRVWKDGDGNTLEEIKRACGEEQSET